MASRACFELGHVILCSTCLLFNSGILSYIDRDIEIDISVAICCCYWFACWKFFVFFLSQVENDLCLGLQNLLSDCLVVLSCEWFDKNWLTDWLLLLFTMFAISFCTSGLGVENSLFKWFSLSCLLVVVVLSLCQLLHTSTILVGGDTWWWRSRVLFFWGSRLDWTVGEGGESVWQSFFALDSETPFQLSHYDGRTFAWVATHTTSWVD